jgi:predicted metal-dependent hydrolase
VRIHVYPGGDVEIEAPDSASDTDIVKAAQRRARWIVQNRAAALEARSLARQREYVSGETHFYLGRRHKLIVKETAETPSGVKLLRGRLEVTLPVADPAAVKRRLNAWYLERATDYFGTKVAEIAGRLPWISSAPPLKLMRMSKQWGSCSPDGVVYLNPALIRAPRHCIEYVVIHELCHLAEHNHSKRFFELLSRQMGAWETAKAELDGLAELILA